MTTIRSIVRSTLAIALFGSAVGTLVGISGCGVVPTNDPVHQMWLRCESLARQRYGQSGWQITILQNCDMYQDSDGCCRFSGNMPPAAQTAPGCGGAGCRCSSENACENGFECVNGKCSGKVNAYCQNHWTCQSNFCQTVDLRAGDSPNCRNTNGAECANDNQCATQLGLICDTTKQVCLAKDGAACTVPQHCQSGTCTNNKCAPPCMDGAKNGTETDVDCGGGTCNKCANGAACVAATDCTSGTCTNNKCAAPTCTDGVKNGTETDVDCGGGTCPRCDLRAICTRNEDCKQGLICGGEQPPYICKQP